LSWDKSVVLDKNCG